MRRLIWKLTALAVLLAPCLVIGAPGSLAPQQSEAASVTVKVTPRALEGPVWEFQLVFETHSQELSDDVLKSAVLVDSKGVEIAPIEWKGAPPGGHHRSGVLRFKALDPVPPQLELRIRRAGEPSARSFRWAMR